MSEDETTEATEATEATEPSSSRAVLRKWTTIGAGVAAAIVAVLVSLGVIEGDTGDELTENADCVRRCLAEEAPVEEAPVEEAPVEEEPVDRETSPWPD